MRLVMLVIALSGVQTGAFAQQQVYLKTGDEMTIGNVRVYCVAEKQEKKRRSEQQDLYGPMCDKFFSDDECATLPVGTACMADGERLGVCVQESMLGERRDCTCVVKKAKKK